MIKKNNIMVILRSYEYKCKYRQKKKGRKKNQNTQRIIFNSKY